MKRLLSACCIAVAALAGHGMATAQDLHVSARVGTLGPGLEVAHELTPRLGLRGGATYLPYSREGILLEDMGDIDLYLDAQMKMTTVQALLDFYPFKNVLRLTGGLIYNGSSIRAKLRPAEAYTLEGHTFQPEQIGSLEATVGFKAKVNPYLGLGLGGSPRGRVGVSFDLGMLYTNAARVGMTGTGMIAPTATQAPSLEEGLQSFRFYPVVSLGLAFRVL